MCGRYQVKDPKAAEEIIRVMCGSLTPLTARYNVAPSQMMPTVSIGPEGAPRASMMRWGLVPFWDKSEKPKIAPINARSEEILSKPMFRQAVQKRRCAVVADGFYEWKTMAPDLKQPFSIQLRGGRPFFIAGIFEDERDEPRRPATYALLTTRPNQLMESIHDRMPVIMDVDTARAWVAAGDLSADRLAALAAPYDAAAMEAFPVSRLVNYPKNDSPEVARRVDDEGSFSLE